MNIPGVFSMKSRLLAVMASAVLAACGGGGGSAGDCKFNNCGTDTQVADLIVALDKSSVSNSGTDVVTVTVTAVDKSRNAMSGVAVKLVPDDTAVATTSASATNASGILTGTVGIGSDRSNRTVQVQVSSGSITKTTSFAVTGATLSATLLPADIAPSAAGKIQFNLVDGNNKAMANQTVEVSESSNAVPKVSGVTDSTGSFIYDYSAPSTLQVLHFTGSAAGETITGLDVTVTDGTSTHAPATGVVRTQSVQINPSNLSVNKSGSTTNRGEVRAIFLTDLLHPIENLRVRFDLGGDLYGYGGSFSSDGAIVYTNANGIASTQFIAGSRPTGTNGVTIRACWDYSDFPANTCPNQTPLPAVSGSPQTTATVVGDSVSLAIFTNGKITVDDDKSVYQQAYSVQVVDSAGQPLSGVKVSGLVDILTYGRGYWYPGDKAWLQVKLASCDNEDINRSGTLDTFSNGQTEDANGSFRLEPSKADITLFPASTGSDVTDSFGKAYFYVQFGQNLGGWETFQLQFNVVVLGTEWRQTYSDETGVPASVVLAVTSKPPFMISPYGEAAPTATASAPTGYLAVTEPTSGKTASLCVK